MDISCRRVSHSNELCFTWRKLDSGHVWFAFKWIYCPLAVWWAETDHDQIHSVGGNEESGSDTESKVQPDASVCLFVCVMNILMWSLSAAREAKQLQHWRLTAHTEAEHRQHRADQLRLWASLILCHSEFIHSLSLQLQKINMFFTNFSRCLEIWK